MPVRPAVRGCAAGVGMTWRVRHVLSRIYEPVTVPGESERAPVVLAGLLNLVRVAIWNAQRGRAVTLLDTLCSLEPCGAV